MISIFKYHVNNVAFGYANHSTRLAYVYQISEFIMVHGVQNMAHFVIESLVTV